MKFRYTLVVVCLMLVWLGAADLLFYLRNPAPVTIDVGQLHQGPLPADWLRIEGGVLDLREAISTSGGLEVEALLVPVLSEPPAQGARTVGALRLLLETRDPELIHHFKVYHFVLEDDAARAAYLEEHRNIFHSRTPRTGLVSSGARAQSNRRNLMKLAQEVGVRVDEDVIFFSEGGTPKFWGGALLLALGVAGLVRLLLGARRRKV